MILIVLGIKVLALDVYPRITVVALNSSMIGGNWLGANSTWVLNISIIDWHRGKRGGCEYMGRNETIPDNQEGLKKQETAILVIHTNNQQIN